MTAKAPPEKTKGPLPGFSRAPPLARRGFTLTFRDRGIVRRYTVSRGVTTVGRSPKCHIRIGGDGVAPLHCRIEGTARGDLVLFAESDSHPVLVEGVPVQFARLGGGEKIRIGPAALEVGRSFHIGRQGDEVRRDFFFENDFGALMVRSIKKTHWIAFSLAIHLFVLYMVSLSLAQEKPLGPSGFSFQNDIAGAPGDFPIEKGSPEEQEKAAFDEPEKPPEENLAQAPESMAASDPPPGEKADSLDPSRSGPFGGGGEGLDVAASERIGRIVHHGGAEGRLFGKGSGWSEHVGRLRSTGLDVAVLFDSTGSMAGVTAEVRGAVGKLVRALDRIVPDLRVSLVTYKGDPDASRYVTAGTPLVKDPFELLNFMNSVEISGGSPQGYAAVCRGLAAAIRGLSWRARTEKAVVIIGDAAPFPGETAKISGMVRRFKGTVSAIYKNSEGTPEELESETLDAFRALARSGRGVFIRYDETGNIVRRIAEAILGPEWSGEIARVFAYQEKGRWRTILERHVAEKDVDWLFKQFLKRDNRPEAVDALASVGGKEAAEKIFALLQKRSLPPWLLQRSLYVLGKLGHVRIDYVTSSRGSLRRDQLRRIAYFLTVVFGKDFGR